MALKDFTDEQIEQILNRNILVNDSEVELGEYTKRLVSMIKRFIGWKDPSEENPHGTI